MRRYLFVLFGAVVLWFVTAALAAGPNIPTLFAHQIAAVKHDTRAPAILLPTSIPIGDVGPHAPKHPHLYAQGGTQGASYYFDLGAVPNCGGADACSVASFSGAKGGKIFPGFTTVPLPGASQAQYHGLLCGASCSPPQIEYIVHGVLYTIQANLTVSASEYESTMIAAAEQSIKAGPR
jgi:hypothetical protein